MTPLWGQALLLLPNEISMVDWIPCIFSLLASSSQVSFQDFLPKLLVSCSMESSLEEPELSVDFFLAISAQEGEYLGLLGEG